MTVRVRWKPLLVLSGLFVVVALLGVFAIVAALAPRSAEGTLRRARAEQSAGRFEDAEIHFKQALQIDGKSAAIHESFAEMYREWSKNAPAQKKAALRAQELGQLVAAARLDKGLAGPRRALLKNAMDQDLTADSVYWSRELLNLEPRDPDAHHALAVAELERHVPNVPDVRRHLEALDQAGASLARRLWIRARLAEATGDPAARDAALAQARTLKAPANGDVADRLALLQLTALAVRSETDKARLSDLVERLREQVRGLGKPEEMPSARVARLAALLEQSQRALLALASKLPPDGKTTVDGLIDAIEVDLNSIFQQVLADGRQAELATDLAYALHLRFRQKPGPCLDVIGRALARAEKSPPRKPDLPALMSLRVLAAETVLARADDADRFDKARPHVQALLSGPDARFQAYGHLFAGSIDLERMELARGPKVGQGPAPNDKGPSAGGEAGRSTTSAAEAESESVDLSKLRSSALAHLKAAALGLPALAEAQARYGVALVLAQEPNLGRQYLQTALRLGGLEPRYQLWAAWTVLQAGYPEEAEPIVQSLFEQIARGDLPREMEGSLHLLQGELYQARRGPGDLEKAAAEFDKARGAGLATTPTAMVRLAQIDVQTGRFDQAMARLEALRKRGEDSEAAEHLAVLVLEETGKKTEARARLRQARSAHPKSSELAGLEAALSIKDDRPQNADQVLEAFLKDQPDATELAIMRAQLQAGPLKNVEKARELLNAAADRSDTSAPLVQLAGLEIDHNRMAEAEAAVARIRSRWKEAAAADVLDAQIALKRGKIGEAREHFNIALKKDPDNKIVRFWKAQLDGQAGSVDEAAQALEAIVRDRPVKEVDSGTSLFSAAQSALANLSLRSRDYDGAIRRFEELRKNGEAGALSRRDRWMLITAYIHKGQWPRAKRELAAVLNDAKEPPTHEERIQGAEFYRQQGDTEAALAQIDYVLSVEPANVQAVVRRSFILLAAHQVEPAGAILRKAIELSNKGPNPSAGSGAKTDANAKDAPKTPAVFYLMLAAVENETPPKSSAVKRALTALDAGLKSHPADLELIQAKYLALASSGDASGALAFLEALDRQSPKGPVRRLLVEKYREQKRYGPAEKLLAELHKESPDDPNLAAALLQVVSLEAAEAGALKQADRQQRLNDRAASMVRQFRARYAQSASFLQAECDMAAREGDLNRALAITREIDKIAKTSPLGPLLRARLYSVMKKPRDLAQAYAEALERESGQRGQLDLRVLLGNTQLDDGRPGEALKQAKLVLDVDKNRTDALLLWARSLVEASATPSERSARRAEAAARLRQAVQDDPAFVEAYHALADVYLSGRGAAGSGAAAPTREDRGAAIAALKDGLRANPSDRAGAGRLVQLLAERSPDGGPPAAADLDEARRLTREARERDAQGQMVLSMAIGLHRAGQLELALPMARDAVAKLGSPAAHLNLGDLLLTIAESQNSSDAATARKTFEEAIAQYDRVLKDDPNSVEAVNNKAWILNTYLGRGAEALASAQDLRKRVSPAVLPGEFYDTLGVIQESVGQSTAAERSYIDGLKKSPENPALNFHFGKLLAADRDRAIKARTYLNKALLARERLNPAMAHEAEQLVRRLGGGIRAN